MINTYNNSNTPVYIEEYSFLENNGSITNSSNISINEKQSFIYNDYNSIVLNYKNTFNIGVTSYFQYTFEINVNNNELSEKSIQTITISFNEKVFQ